MLEDLKKVSQDLAKMAEKIDSQEIDPKRLRRLDPNKVLDFLKFYGRR